MWCAQCQQDIPTIARGDGGLTCFRCGEPSQSQSGGDARETPLDGARQAKTRHLGDNGGATSDTSSVFSPAVARGDSGDSVVGETPYIPWEWDQLLSHWEGVLRQPEPGRPSGGFHRAEGKHRQPRPNHFRKDRSWWFAPSNTGVGKADSVAWLVFLVGAAVVVCGANLVGWGLVLDSPELGLWGVPVAVIGLVLLVSGIFFRLGELKPKSGLRPPDDALRFPWQSCHDCEPAAPTAACHDTHGKAHQG